MIPSLPTNVISEVCRHLEQKDLLSFALTCREVFEIAHPYIYSSVVVDSSKQVFHETSNHSLDRYLYSNKDACPTETPVKIRSLWSLVKFFKVLLQNPHYGRFIHSIVVHNEFPDIPQPDLDQYVRSIFPYLVNLRFLNWYSVHRPLDAGAVYLLPNPHQLISACGNFVYNRFENTKIEFPFLKHLDLSNLNNEKSLTGIDLQSFPQIKTLTLSKSVSHNTLQFSPGSTSCCKNAVTEDLADASSLTKVAFSLGSFFHSSSSSLLDLDSLVLREIAVSANDATLISKKVNFSTLKHLSIDNCSEILFENEPPLSANFNLLRRNPPAVMFLDNIPELPSLESLNINLTNELCFNSSTSKFISRLRGLKKLAVHIKVFQSNDPISLAPLITSFQPHADTLEYLNVCCDVVDNTQPNLTCPRKKNQFVLKTLVGLTSMKKLKSLRLPVSFAQLSKIPDILSELQDLRCIHLPITDSAASMAACNGCDKSFISAISSSNCLVAQDYFDCPTAFNTSVEQKKNEQYLNISKDYKRTFPRLQFLRFDLKSESLVYDISKSNIQMVGTLVDSFDLIGLEV